MTSNLIPRKFGPLVNQAVYAGNPHTAIAELELSHQTQALAFRGIGNSHTLVWPDPDNAPQCTITAASTETSFIMPGSVTPDLLIAWFGQVNHAEVHALAVIASSAHGYDLQFRLTSETAVTAVTTTNGPWSAITQGIGQTFAQELWRRDTGAVWHMLPVRMQVTPDYDTDRLVVLRLEAQAPVRPAPIVSALSISLKLASICLMDVHDSARM